VHGDGPDICPSVERVQEVPQCSPADLKNMGNSFSRKGVDDIIRYFDAGSGDNP